MKIKSLILRWLALLLTPVAVLFFGSALLQSWLEPQIQPQLELYQTNLLLYAMEWQEQEAAQSPLLSAWGQDEPLKMAIAQYETTQRSISKQISARQAQVEQATAHSVSQSQIRPLQQVALQLQGLNQTLTLELGLLKARENQPTQAREYWQRLIQSSPDDSSALVPEPTVQIAKTLSGLWSDPPRLFPEAEESIQQSLQGWFRYQALARLYQLQQRSAELTKLQADEYPKMEQAVVKLSLLNGLPFVGIVIGSVLLIGLVVQWGLQGKKSLLMHNSQQTWSVPWSGETILQVFVIGFFLVGQVLVGQILRSQLLPPSQLVNLTLRSQAFWTLATYGLVAAGTLGTAWLILQPYRPWPEGWFRLQWQGSWSLWGVGGYWVALPLVILVSWLNQQIWQGQGGSNPLLEVILSGQDKIALLVFGATAVIAAPLFEETLFRGFLLPSLSRYLPGWAAIVLSALAFAIAHLSLSELFPLTVLGIVLGVVYTRSRNLLAPMLLHSLWNGGTLLGLYILGSN